MVAIGLLELNMLTKKGNHNFAAAFGEWARKNGIDPGRCEYRMMKKHKNVAVKTTDPRVEALIDDGYVIKNVTDESGKVIFTPEEALKKILPFFLPFIC